MGFPQGYNPMSYNPTYNRKGPTNSRKGFIHWLWMVMGNQYGNFFTVTK